MLPWPATNHFGGSTVVHRYFVVSSYNGAMEGTPVSQKLYLLGSPRLEQDGVTVRFGRRKALAILAHLAVTAQPQSRDTLLALLWPEYNSDSARANLRRDLARLRKVVGSEVVKSGSGQLTFDPETGLWVDILQFRALLATVAEHQHENDTLCPDCLEHLTTAASLYGADFMAGFSLNDASGFDDWQYYQSSVLRHELTTVLKKLLAAHSARGDYNAALPHSSRWLAIDPLHEPAQRELIQLLAWSEQQSAALTQNDLSERVTQRYLMTVTQACLDRDMPNALAYSLPLIMLLLIKQYRDDTAQRAHKTSELIQELFESLNTYPLYKAQFNHIPYYQPLREWRASVYPKAYNIEFNLGAISDLGALGLKIIDELLKIGWPKPEPFDVDEAFALLGIAEASEEEMNGPGNRVLGG